MEGMIVDISSQWLAILLAAVIVWLASAIVWMALPHHKSDFKALPNEDAAIDALRPQNLSPGVYTIPHCADWKDQTKPEVIEKFKNGPVGMFTVLPNGIPNMSKSLILSFIYNLFIGVIVAYVLSRSIITPDVEYLTVFRLAGVTAWSAYGLAFIWQPIWFGMPWSTTIKHLADALLYALLTAGVFAWQWPG
ncbi:hypothetical protein JYT16_00065 [Gemmatimonas aurantiaca]|nr:hypothetical protein [Gemmatimonas aurantiaca]